MFAIHIFPDGIFFYAFICDFNVKMPFAIIIIIINIIPWVHNIAYCLMKVEYIKV